MRLLIGVVAVAVPLALVGPVPAIADAGGEVWDSVTGSSDGETATADAAAVTPGSPAPPPDQRLPGDGDTAQAAPDSNDASEGPVCHYEPLRFTTQDEQRTEIRPEEQRPGAWGWLVCDDGTEEFRFFPDTPDTPAAPTAAAPVDPIVLAESVQLTPGVPPLQTSPPLDAYHLVNFESWFWVGAPDWAPRSAGARAGPVTVEVTATPTRLVVDPGEGSPSIDCPGGGIPYDEALPAEGQSSGCTHLYERAGVYTATATVVYDVSWSANIDPGPHQLEPITPAPVPVTIEVAEAQAVVTD